MRILLVALVLGLAACASGAPTSAEGPSPFPVARGTAPPPPAEARPGRTAPPQGVGPGGFDFGQWRSADAAAYASALQAQARQRYTGRSQTDIAADLTANGFACEQGERVDCRIEIMERECAHDWYVVVERGRDPVAGYDVMCLGAR
ncbi:MAG: hypothetical protein KF700_02085 [Hyphomonadaceae bacterium]|nr:hypothetical protein [Hyphomonadaceae bacterium]